MYSVKLITRGNYIMQDHKTSKLGLNETLTTPLQNYDSTGLALRVINDNVSSTNAGLLSIARTLGSLYKKVLAMEERRDEGNIVPGESSVETKALVRKLKLLEKTQKAHGEKLEQIFDLLQKATAPAEEEHVEEVRTYSVAPIMESPGLDFVIED